MAKAKKKSPARPAAKAPAFPASSLAPQVLEQAARGWLQSTGIPSPTARPTRTASDHRLAEALTETLQQLRAEIADLRSRLDRLEHR
jgi:hypothetical protein